MISMSELPIDFKGLRNFAMIASFGVALITVLIMIFDPNTRQIKELCIGSFIGCWIVAGVLTIIDNYKIVKKNKGDNND